MWATVVFQVCSVSWLTTARAPCAVDKASGCDGIDFSTYRFRGNHWRGMKRGIRYIWTALVLALLLAERAISQTADIGWPEAVSRLAGERSRAEICVALLKGHGNEAQIAHGRLAYGNAKADFDSVIAGLETALAQSATPISFSNLNAALERGASGRGELCKSVADLLPNTSGQKSILADIVKSAIVPPIKALSDAVSAIYNNYRQDNVLTRKSIQTQLEAARWPDFAKVEAVQ
jgi:hypothetical protein